MGISEGLIKAARDLPPWKAEYHPYIPSHWWVEGRMTNLYKAVLWSWGREGKLVIDVGCGLGENLSQLHLELYDSRSGTPHFVGLEVNPILCEQANLYKSHTFGNNYYEIINEDAFEHSFELYDRVYTYCPINNLDLCSKLYKKIFQELPIGARWFEFLGLDALVGRLNPESKSFFGDIGHIIKTGYDQLQSISFKVSIKSEVEEVRI